MKPKRFSWFVRDISFYKKLILIALPMAGQSVISFGVGLVGNLMVAHLGEGSISGIYVANQIQGILHMFVMGLGAALVILAAQYFGRGDTRSVKTFTSFSIQLAVGVGAALFLLMTFFGRPILSLLSNSTPAIEEGLVYMSWLRWSFIIFAITHVMLAAMRCTGQVNVGIVASTTAFLVTIFFNYVFIYGNLGAPEMGVAGAALAILLARIVECVVVLTFVLRIDKKLKYRPKDLLLRNKTLSFDYFRYGLPVILGDITWGFGNTAKSAIIGRLGTSVIAASSIVGNFSQLFAIFVYGLASAGSLTVGQVIGKNDFETAKKYTKTLQVLYPCVGLISASVMFVMRSAVLSLPQFQELTSETMEFCFQFFTILCVTLVGTSYQMSTLQIVRAGGATHFVFINDLIFVWLVMIPMALLGLLVFDAPPWFIFFAIHCDQILKAFVAVVKVNRFRWMKNLTRTDQI